MGIALMGSRRTVKGMTPSETKNLSWKDAWWYLLNGKKIKRPLWDGYWVWENNTIMMHCRDGSVTDIRDTEFPAYTFSNIAERDWMVVEEKSDSEILQDKIEKAMRASIMC